MKIRKIESDDEVVLIYDFYLSANEPDSPKIAFNELDSAAQDAIFKKYREINEIVENEEGLIIGFIATTPIEDGINLGGAVFPEFRKKSYASEFLKQKVNELIAKPANGRIFASTRSKNLAAIGALKKAGFTFSKQESKPPIGDYAEPIEYDVYEYIIK